MSRMSIKHTGTHTPSRIPRKGTMCVLRHTRPTFGELDMICLMAGSPDPGSFSLILAPSSLPLPVLPARPTRLLMATSSSWSPPSVRTGDGIDTISLLYLFTRNSMARIPAHRRGFIECGEKRGELLRARLRVTFLFFFFKRFQLFHIQKMSLTLDDRVKQLDSRHEASRFVE